VAALEQRVCWKVLALRVVSGAVPHFVAVAGVQAAEQLVEQVLGLLVEDPVLQDREVLHGAAAALTESLALWLCAALSEDLA